MPALDLHLDLAPPSEPGLHLGGAERSEGDQIETIGLRSRCPCDLAQLRGLEQRAYGRVGPAAARQLKGEADRVLSHGEGRRHLRGLRGSQDERVRGHVQRPDRLQEADDAMDLGARPPGDARFEPGGQMIDRGQEHVRLLGRYCGAPFFQDRERVLERVGQARQLLEPDRCAVALQGVRGPAKRLQALRRGPVSLQLQHGRPERVERDPALVEEGLPQLLDLVRGQETVVESGAAHDCFT